MQTLLFLSLTVLSHSFFRLEQLSGISVQALKADPFVQVSLNFDPIIDNTVNQYYQLEVLSTSKTSATFKLNRLENKFFKILRKLHLVNFKHQFIKMKIKPRFISQKRKWSLSLVYQVSGTLETITKCSQRVKRIGGRKMTDQSQQQLLRGKGKAMKLFRRAYSLLETELQRFVGFYVTEVQKVQLLGGQKYAQLIENQLQNQFSDSQSRISISKFPSYSSNEPVQSQNSSIMVVFQVTEMTDEEQSEYTSRYSEDDSESIESDQQKASQ